MKILVIGSGGREHALAWKIAQSEKTDKIWVAPGNGGTAGEDKTENLSLDAATEEGRKALLEFALKEKIDLTVVGPEDPLAAGIVDNFRAAGLAIIGPDKKAALLEASKVYSNIFMKRYGVRTAKRESFDDVVSALAFAENHFNDKEKNLIPLVIKADGLASGKGVVIAQTLSEAAECISSFMEKASLGESGKSIVFEEFLKGREVSVMAAVSILTGRKGFIKPFISARDHKNRFEGSKGPNTGGMGAIAPVPDFNENIQKDFENAILLPTLKGMEVEQLDYRGFIFFGLMVKEEQCYLLEYNVRLGDPETQALLPLMGSDFPELCLSILDGSLGTFNFKWKNKAACAPVAVAQGYPGAYRKGDFITVDHEGLNNNGVELFIAGAKSSDTGLISSGGRVLSLCALGADVGEARIKAYEALKFVNFEGMDYRKDIGLEENYG